MPSWRSTLRGAQNERLQAPNVSAELPHQQLARVSELALGLVDLLVEKKLITAAGLAAAVEAQQSGPT